jgi:hypothetical protein
LLVSLSDLVQTGLTMKTPSATPKLVAMAAIAVLTILAFQACETIAPGTRFGLEIREGFRLRSIPRFLRMAHTLSRSAFWEFHVVYEDGTSKDFRSGSPLNIKTDKVTMFEVPKSTTGEFTAIGANVTQRVYSNSITDIDRVLEELKKQQH